MRILSIECSASPASCAVIDDGKILASSYINVKLTHSQTLMQVILDTLKNSNISLDTIKEFAVAVGPGSFTGLRIGISAIKGLAAPRSLPCVGVSTLAAMAENFSEFDCILCAVMDARCNQFYNAIFDIENGKITRLCEDRALLADELAAEIKRISAKKRVIICGDGADLFYNNVSDIENVKVAPENIKYQNAVGVGIYVFKNIYTVHTVSPENLLPGYLRLPQAERELKAKTEAKK